MSTDIGARIGIDGEKGFRDSLSAINSQLKNLGSEMKSVVASFSGMEDSEEAVSKKGDVLQRSISATSDKINVLESQAERARNKLADLGLAADKAAQEFGDTSSEALKAQNAFNKQARTVNTLESQINDAKASMANMERQMKSLGDESDDLDDNFGNSVNTLKQGFTVGAVSGAVQSLIGSISGLVQESTEYRKIMGTLQTSSQQAGYTAEETEQTYRQLFGVIGDQQAAATAAANLQAIGLSQDELTKLTDAAIGAWATYGDSIPIDGLAEAINETIQVGQVTGTFADALNWAGVSEDAFNEKLAAAGSETERAKLVLDQLSSQGLPQAAEAWRQNNEQLLLANEATASMDSAVGQLGERLSPIMTTVTESVAGAVVSLLDLATKLEPLAPTMAAVAAAAAVMAVALNFSTIVGTLAGALTTAAKGFDALSIAMASNPIGLVITLVTALVAAFITAYNTSDEFRAKVDAALSKVSEVVGNVVDAIDNFLIKTLPEAVNNAINALKEFPGKMMEFGKNLIEGLWNGIENMGTWISNKIKGFGDGVLNTIKDFFGIHSPSTVMRDEVGVYIGEGIAEGITASASTVQKAADHLGYTVVDSMDTMINDLEQKKSSLEDTLNGYGALFERTQTQEGGEVFSLGNLEQQIQDIENYGASLQALKERGVTGALMDEILGMSVEDATDYMDELLSMTDKKLNQYIVLYDQKQEAAAKIAQEFYGKQLDGLRSVANTASSDAQQVVTTALEQANTETKGEDMQAVVDGLTEQEPILLQYIQNLKETIIRLVRGYVPEFNAAGRALMEGMSAGVRAGKSGLVNTIISAIEEAIREAQAALEIHSPSKVTARMIGEPMGAGVAAGWADALSQSKNSMAMALQTPISQISTEDLYNSASGIVNGIAAADTAYGKQTVIIPLNIDGKQVAEVVYDPLKQIKAQRGQ